MTHCDDKTKEMMFFDSDDEKQSEPFREKRRPPRVVTSQRIEAEKKPSTTMPRIGIRGSLISTAINYLHLPKEYSGINGRVRDDGDKASFEILGEGGKSGYILNKDVSMQKMDSFKKDVKTYIDQIVCYAKERASKELALSIALSSSKVPNVSSTVDTLQKPLAVDEEKDLALETITGSSDCNIGNEENLRKCPDPRDSKRKAVFKILDKDVQQENIVRPRETLQDKGIDINNVKSYVQQIIMRAKERVVKEEKTNNLPFQVETKPNLSSRDDGMKTPNNAEVKDDKASKAETRYSAGNIANEGDLGQSHNPCNSIQKVNCLIPSNDVQQEKIANSKVNAEKLELNMKDVKMYIDGVIARAKVRIAKEDKIAYPPSQVEPKPYFTSVDDSLKIPDNFEVQPGNSCEVETGYSAGKIANGGDPGQSHDPNDSKQKADCINNDEVQENIVCPEESTQKMGFDIRDVKSFVEKVIARAKEREEKEGGMANTSSQVESKPVFSSVDDSLKIAKNDKDFGNVMESETEAGNIDNEESHGKSPDPENSKKYQIFGDDERQENIAKPRKSARKTGFDIQDVKSYVAQVISRAMERVEKEEEITKISPQDEIQPNSMDDSLKKISDVDVENSNVFEAETESPTVDNERYLGKGLDQKGSNKEASCQAFSYDRRQRNMLIPRESPQMAMFEINDVRSYVEQVIAHAQKRIAKEEMMAHNEGPEEMKPNLNSSLDSLNISQEANASIGTTITGESVLSDDENPRNIPNLNELTQEKELDFRGDESYVNGIILQAQKGMMEGNRIAVVKYKGEILQSNSSTFDNLELAIAMSPGNVIPVLSPSIDNLKKPQNVNVGPILKESEQNDDFDFKGVNDYIEEIILRAKERVIQENKLISTASQSTSKKVLSDSSKVVKTQIPRQIGKGINAGIVSSDADISKLENRGKIKTLDESTHRIPTAIDTQRVSFLDTRVSKPNMDIDLKQVKSYIEQVIVQAKKRVIKEKIMMDSVIYTTGATENVPSPVTLKAILPNNGTGQCVTSIQPDIDSPVFNVGDFDNRECIVAFGTESDTAVTWKDGRPAQVFNMRETTRNSQIQLKDVRSYVSNIIIQAQNRLAQDYIKSLKMSNAGTECKSAVFTDELKAQTESFGGDFTFDKVMLPTNVTNGNDIACEANNGSSTVKAVDNDIHLTRTTSEFGYATEYICNDKKQGIILRESLQKIDFKLKDVRADIAEKIDFKLKDVRADIAEKIDFKLKDVRADISEKIDFKLKDVREDIAEKIDFKLKDVRADIADIITEARNGIIKDDDTAFSMSNREENKISGQSAASNDKLQQELGDSDENYKDKDAKDAEENNFVEKGLNKVIKDIYVDIDKVVCYVKELLTDDQKREISEYCRTNATSMIGWDNSNSSDIIPGEEMATNLNRTNDIAMENDFGPLVENITACAKQIIDDAKRGILTEKSMAMDKLNIETVGKTRTILYDKTRIPKGENINEKRDREDKDDGGTHCYESNDTTANIDKRENSHSEQMHDIIDDRIIKDNKLINAMSEEESTGKSSPSFAGPMKIDKRAEEVKGPKLSNKKALSKLIRLPNKPAIMTTSSATTVKPTQPLLIGQIERRKKLEIDKGDSLKETLPQLGNHFEVKFSDWRNRPQCKVNKFGEIMGLRKNIEGLDKPQTVGNIAEMSAVQSMLVEKNRDHMQSEINDNHFVSPTRDETTPSESLNQQECHNISEPPSHRAHSNDLLIEKQNDNNKTRFNRRIKSAILPPLGPGRPNFQPKRDLSMPDLRKLRNGLNPMSINKDDRGIKAQNTFRESSGDNQLTTPRQNSSVSAPIDAGQYQLPPASDIVESDRSRSDLRAHENGQRYVSPVPSEFEESTKRFDEKQGTGSPVHQEKLQMSSQKPAREPRNHASSANQLGVSAQVDVTNTKTKKRRQKETTNIKSSESSPGKAASTKGPLPPIRDRFSPDLKQKENIFKRLNHKPPIIVDNSINYRPPWNASTKLRSEWEETRIRQLKKSKAGVDQSKSDDPLPVSEFIKYRPLPGISNTNGNEISTNDRSDNLVSKNSDPGGRKPLRKVLPAIKARIPNKECKGIIKKMSKIEGKTNSSDISDGQTIITGSKQHGLSTTSLKNKHGARQRIEEIETKDNVRASYSANRNGNNRGRESRSSGSASYRSDSSEPSDSVSCSMISSVSSVSLGDIMDEPSRRINSASSSVSASNRSVSTTSNLFAPRGKLILNSDIGKYSARMYKPDSTDGDKSQKFSDAVIRVDRITENHIDTRDSKSSLRTSSLYSSVNGSPRVELSFKGLSVVRLSDCASKELIKDKMCKKNIPINHENQNL